MFSEILKALRLQAGLTQKQVADALNIDRSTYSYYEIGSSHPGYDGLTKLSKIFNVSTDFLLGNSSTIAEFRDESLVNFNFGIDLPCNISDLTRDEQRLVILYRLSKNKEKIIDYVVEDSLSDIENE